MEQLLKCSKCKQEKPVSEFHVCKIWKRGYAYKCKECVREHKNKPDVRARTYEREKGYREAGINKLARRNRRIDTIKKLGGKCECCGEERLEFLAIDHIDGLVKRTRNESGDALVLKVKKSNFSKEQYRVLCHNCNSSIGFYGYCPHKTKKDFLKR